MKRFCQLGTLIPLILTTALLADLGLRLLPFHYFTFRGWEAAFVSPSAIRPFRPCQHYHKPQAYGDLAARGNLPRLRQLRPEVFTTDELGYRNSPLAARQRPVDIMLVGTSFTAGCAVSDDQTLASQLERRSGLSVYNAGSGDVTLERIREDAQRLGMRRGLVIYEYLERCPPPGSLCNRRRHHAVSYWREAFSTELRRSPLRILAERGYKLLQNDWLLPNACADRVVAGSLRNGATMLFLPGDVASYGRPRANLDQVGPCFQELAEQLRRDGLDLLVMLVPDKYSVYQPLLRDPAADPAKDQYLDLVERELRQGGIPVVNCAALFRRQAPALLEQGIYLYCLDDTHWNAAGIALAAEEVNQACQALAVPAGDY